jgi:DNA-directed RNA polymerase subunit K/omega
VSLSLAEPRLTKYEETYLKGARWTQLIQGAPPAVDTTGCANEKEIMEREFQMGRIPLAILRTIRTKKGVLDQQVLRLAQMHIVPPSASFFVSDASTIVSEPTKDTPLDTEGTSVPTNPKPSRKRVPSKRTTRSKTA